MVQGAKAGKISKPYGLQGEVLVILNPLIATHIQTGNPLFIEIDGQGVPFFMEAVQWLAEDLAHIKFEFIHSVEEARKISGCEVYLDPMRSGGVSEESDDPQKVVGYTAFDQRVGSLGIVREYLPHPLNPQWQVDHEGKELLIPVNADFVLEIRHKKKEIHFILPEGLTDL